MKMTKQKERLVSTEKRSAGLFSSMIVGIRLTLLRILFGKSARGFLRHFDSWDGTIADLTIRMGKVERRTEHINAANETLAIREDIVERNVRSNEDDRKWDNFWVAYSEWWTNGASDALVDTFYLRERIEHFWNRELPTYWLIYICCLIERGLTGHALNMARKFVSRFGYGEMFRYLPAASLAAKHLPGCPPQVLSAAVLFEKMSDPKRFNTFSSFLKGKTIAVVGNNRREVGRGLGSKIDAHDVVIRFNDHSFYRPEDYGSKMTIWCRNGSPTMFPDDERDLRETRFIVFMDDYWHTFVQGELLPVLGKRFDADTPVSVSPPSGIGASLRKESGLRNTTSGAYMVWLLRHVLGSFSGVDFYGFAFLDGNLSKDDTHADELFAWHEIDGEMQFLRKITSSSQ